METLCSLATQFIEQFTYLGIVGVLMLCGMGLPVPEEVTILAAGYLAYRGVTDFWLTIAVCLFGVIASDLLSFYLGRRWGGQLLGHPIMQKFISEEKLAKVRARLDEHHLKAIFLFRFLPGVRTPGFFTAGSLGMRYRRFLLVDLIACLLSVPLFITIAYHFGEHVDEAAKWLKGLNRFGAAAAGVAVVVVLLIAWRVRKKHHSESS